jgi:hypothetical protein
LALYNKELDEVVLENAPKNVKYTSPDVQKEILFLKMCIARFSLRRRELQLSNLRRTPKVRRKKVKTTTTTDQHGQRHTNRKNSPSGIT